MVLTSQNTSEVCQPRVFWEFPGIKSAYASQNEVCRIVYDGTRCKVGYFQSPGPGRRVPTGVFDSVLKPGVLVDIVLLSNRLPVFSNLCSRGEFVGPVSLGTECGLIDV